MWGAECGLQIESLPENSDFSTQENSPTSLSETESDADNSSLISDSPTPENYESSSIETSIPEKPQVDEPLPDLDIPPTITPEPVQAVQAVRSSRSDREIKRPRYVLLTEYFPVTKRQMKQCWRSLRRPIRQGVPTELDIEETVAKIGREGILLQPLLIPPRTNHSDLVLLIATRRILDENQELRNLFQQLEYYIDCDPEARLRNCHLQKHPECNCQLLAQRRLLKDPPNILTNIAQDLNLTSAQVARHWSKCKNILQEIVTNIGYLPE